MPILRFSMKKFQEQLKQKEEHIQITHPGLKLTSTNAMIAMIVENMSSYDLIYKESYLKLLVNGGNMNSIMASTLEGTCKLPSKSASGLFLKGCK